MPKAYHITNWEDRENADTRKYVDLIWFRNKVKLLGEGLGHTLAAPNNRGPHLYGMFKLIEQVAAGGRLEQRGWLYRNNSPLDAPRIANLLRLPVTDVEEALTFFSTPPMNWLEHVELPEDFPGDRPANGDSPETGGRFSGKSPGKSAETGDSPETGGRNAPSDRPTDRSTKTDRPPEREREKKGEELDPAEARKQQTAQFAALNAQLRKLEATPAEDRDDAEEAEIKKVRRQLSAIQKKQGAGDFTPVKEKTK